MADPVIQWGTAMFYMAIIFIFFFPIIIMWHRKVPLIAARMPYIIVTEMLFDLVLLALASSSWTDFAEAWNPCPCWLQNFLLVAFGSTVFNVTSARIAILYRQIQVNTWEEKIENTWTDTFVHYLGKFNAPREFDRLELRLALLQRAHTTSQFGPSGRSAKSANGFSLASTPALDDKADTRTIESSNYVSRRDLKEALLWYLKIFAWWMFWGLLSLITTYPNYRDIVMEPVELVAPVCLLPALYITGAQLLSWNLMQLYVVFTLRSKLNDTQGLKTELVIMQSLFALFWGVDGILMLFAQDQYNNVGIWTDFTAMFTHAVFTFGYPLILLYYRRYKQQSLTGRHHLTLAMPGDLEKLWNTETGRNIIMDVTRHAFAFENSLYLIDTQHINKLTLAEAKHLNERYVVEGAPFELNVRNAIRKQFNTSLVKQEGYLEYVEKIRQAVIMMLFENYKSEIVAKTSSTI